MRVFCRHILFAGLTLFAQLAVAQQPLSEAQRQGFIAERNKLRAQVDALEQSGKTKEAIEVVERIIAIQNRALGDNAGTADWWAWVANRHQRQGNFAAAKRAWLEALEMKQRLFGAEHWMVTDLRVLLQTSETVAKLSPQNRQQILEADRLADQGEQLQNEGKYRQAISVLEGAASIRRTLLGPQHPHYGQALSFLGVLHSELGEYEAAERLHKQTVEITKNSLGLRHPNYTSSLNNLAEVYLEQVRLDLAEPLYLEAARIEKEILGEDHPGYATTLNNLSAVFLRTGEMTKAIPLAQQVLAIKEKSLGNDHLDYALALHNLAIMYGEVGDFAQAEPLFRLAADLTAKALGQQHPDYAHRLHSLAQCYERMGDLSRAEPLFHRVLELRRQTLGESHLDYAAVLMDVGNLWFQAKAYKSAERVYRQALEIRKKSLGERHPDYALSLSALADVLRLTGDPISAEALCRTAVRIQKEAFGDAHPLYASALNGLGTHFILQGDFARAQPLYQQAVEILRKLPGGNRHNLAVNLSELATCHQWQGEPEQAAECFREALAIYRDELNQAAVVQSERQQLAMLIDNRVSLDSFLCFATKTPRYRREALAEVLAWQGAVLSRQRAIRAASADPALAPILQELQTTSARLAALSIAVPEGAQPAPSQALLAELSDKVESLEARLSAASKSYREAKAPFSVADLQAALPANATLIEYFEFLKVEPKPQAEGGGLSSEYRTIAFVVPPQGDVKLVDLGPVQPIVDAVAAWHKSVRNAQALDATGNKLREKIWRPLEAQLAGATTILISPYRDLATLPFAALPGRASGTFLIEEYSLAVVPAPQAVAWLNSDSPASKAAGILIVGDVDYDRSKASDAGNLVAAATTKSPSGAVVGRAPRDSQSPAFAHLPGTATELKSIAALYESTHTDAPKLLERAAASEANLIASAGTQRYLHLATHGYFAAERFQSAMSRDFLAARNSQIKLATHQSLGRYHPGLLSGLALAGANQPTAEDDGILTAAEVSTLNLSQAELIVLSACETGLGNFSGSEGLLGLQRAFQVAGAETVVASLWSVPDQATKTLMVRFYENLWQQKLGKLEALREAQLWLLRQGAQQSEIRRELAARGLMEFPGDKEQGTGSSRRLPPYFWAAWVLSGDWR